MIDDWDDDDAGNSPERRAAAFFWANDERLVNFPQQCRKTARTRYWILFKLILNHRCVFNIHLVHSHFHVRTHFIPTSKNHCVFNCLLLH